MVFPDQPLPGQKDGLTLLHQQIGAIQMATFNDHRPAIASKGRVRVASWVVLGVAPSREAYEKLAARRVGNPVRILGLVLAVAIVVAAVALAGFLSGPWLGSKLRAGLERANGATVDLSAASIDLAAGRVSLDGLAKADPDALALDIFRTARVEANLSGADLLRRRFRFDRIVVDLAASGIPRDVPGRRTDTDARAGRGSPAWSRPARMAMVWSACCGRWIG